MLYAYLAALVLGVGTIAVLVLFAHGHGDAHDLHADHGHDGAGSIFLSARFWTFFLLAFGLVGTMLTIFALSGPIVAAVLALLSGLAAGLFAALTFRALKRASSSSTVSLEEAVGQIGRLLLPCEKGKIGKVRLQLRGQSIDVLATAHEEAIAAGKRVVVQEIDGGIALVIAAPDELAA